MHILEVNFVNFTIKTFFPVSFDCRRNFLFDTCSIKRYLKNIVQQVFFVLEPNEKVFTPWTCILWICTANYYEKKNNFLFTSIWRKKIPSQFAMKKMKSLTTVWKNECSRASFIVILFFGSTTNNFLIKSFGASGNWRKL